jgi:hypothetical protein
MLCLLAVSVSAFTACADPTTELHLPSPDPAVFEEKVYPVLLRDCGFPACHGDNRRFFRVFGPGRTRYRAETKPFVAATGEELQDAYDRARSMLTNDEGVEHALLLRKPLAAEHAGVDEWGQNVYRSETDPGYAIIAKWARAVRTSNASNASQAP